MSKNLVISLKNFLNLYKKKNNAYFKLSGSSYLLAKFLYKQGFITGFTIVTKKFKNRPYPYIRVAYSKKSFKNFVFVSKINKKFIYSYHDIQKNMNFKILMIISSDIGLITCSKAVKNKKGGILIGYFIF